MGSDICAETVLDEKSKFLETCLATNSIVVFEHDPEVAAARVTKDERGHFCVKEELLRD
jgi:hypothetical protein